MACHLLCSDGLGRGMAIFSYVVMIAGHLVVFFTVALPNIDQASTLAEYFAYAACWSLMVASHISTMCVDPGFIPAGYKYKEEVLAAPFSTLAAIESAMVNRNREGPADNERAEIEAELRGEDASYRRDQEMSRSKLSSVRDTHERSQSKKR